MKTILAFAGSNSSVSINRRLLLYAAERIGSCDLKILSLRDYAMPLYSHDDEQRSGIPEQARTLNALFGACDGFLLALPEYNSGITPVFKNTVDWISRIETKIFRGKPVCLLAASPGKYGAKSNLAHVADFLMPRWGGTVTGTFSLPEFDRHWVNGELRLEEEEEAALAAVLQTLTAAVE